MDKKLYWDILDNERLALLPFFRADEDNLQIASIEDIGAMKLSAITSRSVLKDYVDLYFILNHINLKALLEVTKEKFPTIDINPILKSLVYFDDIQEEPILFKNDDDVNIETIKSFLTRVVKEYLKDNNNC